MSVNHSNLRQCFFKLFSVFAFIEILVHHFVFQPTREQFTFWRCQFSFWASVAGIRPCHKPYQSVCENVKFPVGQPSCKLAMELCTKYFPTFYTQSDINTCDPEKSCFCRQPDIPPSKGETKKKGDYDWQPMKSPGSHPHHGPPDHLHHDWSGDRANGRQAMRHEAERADWAFDRSRNRAQMRAGMAYGKDWWERRGNVRKKYRGV